MSETPVSGRFTALFENEVLARVERMRLNTTRRFTNRSRGEHLHGKGGSSTEFADYRNYVEGDDVRFVDWNIFARVNRPYLKQFHQEEEQHVVLVVDASASMDFEGKLERAKQMAAAFGVMGLLSTERVSCWVLTGGDGEPRRFGPSTGRMQMRPLFRFIEGIAPGGEEPVEHGIEDVLRLHRGRGVAIVLSDFLTFGDVGRALNLLHSRGLEIFGVQILAPSERDPSIDGDARFVDAETGNTLDVTAAGDLLEIYHEYREAHEQTVATLCRQRSGRFVSIDADEDLRGILFDTMQRQGWVR